MNKTILIKIGSNTLLEENALNTSVIANVAENVDYILKKGYKVLIVTSGAVAAGKSKIGFETPEGIEKVTYKQMCSAVGQAELMKTYMALFSVYHREVAQALVTQDTFRIESQKQNFLQVVQGLVKMGVVTIVNENDVLSSEEIVFSDNDSLAEKIGILLGVEKVIILSNVAGFFDAHPDKGGKLITHVSHINESIYASVDTEFSSFGKGGMKSKIDTAKALMERGITMHLADGRERDILRKIIDGENVGTIFEKVIV